MNSSEPHHTFKSSNTSRAKSTRRWRAIHKWSGIAIALFMLSFVVSGLLLNHRDLILDQEISRRYLPSRYEFRNWNGGLMRGTLRHDSATLIYGVNGVWQYDPVTGITLDFNRGLPSGADRRNIRGMVRTARGTLIAATPFGLHAHRNGRWHPVSIPLTEGEKISDITLSGDTLVAVGRSRIYTATLPSLRFTPVTLPTSPDMDGRTTLFRTVWHLHSGELFGLPGRLAVDAVALLFLFLTVTGIAIWVLKSRGHHPRRVRWNMLWHNRVGRWTVVLTALVVLTGWCLRPPVMVPLALTRVAPLPGTTMSSSNPWHDRIRALRHDPAAGDWLLSTSEGFFTMKSLGDTPRKITQAPPVSVMGINVMERDSAGHWLCGSFSGMYRWDRTSGHVTDWFTGEKADLKPGPPFGRRAVSGYSSHMPGGDVVAEYYDGANLAQPDELRQLPMSLWAVALEMHSGRIFIGDIATYVFIFLTGLAIMLCIYAGYRLRH